MSSNQINKIREEVHDARATIKGRVLYSDKVKKSVIKLLRAGMRPSEIARLTGLNVPAITKWRRRKEFQRVEVAPKLLSEDVAAIFIILPGGIRIECSSARQLKEILENVA